MKYFFPFLLVAICACNSILNEDLNVYLKKHAPFKVYEPSKNPFRNWSDEEIRNLFKDELRPVKKEEKIEFITDVPESFDARDQWPECKREIRDEGSCSATWALSAIEVLDGNFVLPPLVQLILYFLFKTLFHVVLITMVVMEDIMIILGIIYQKLVL